MRENIKEIIINICGKEEAARFFRIFGGKRFYFSAQERGRYWVVLNFHFPKLARKLCAHFKGSWVYIALKDNVTRRKQKALRLIKQLTQMIEYLGDETMELQHYEIKAIGQRSNTHFAR